MTKILTPPTRPPRVSVPVSAEVLVAFERLAAVGNMSTGRAMAEWLSDTVEAAEYMATKMEEARAAPAVVMRELHSYALGMSDETGQLMRHLAAKGKADRSRSSAERGTRGGLPSPPPSNTGGKVPRVNPNTKGV